MKRKGTMNGQENGRGYMKIENKKNQQGGNEKKRCNVNKPKRRGGQIIYKGIKRGNKKRKEREIQTGENKEGEQREE